MTRHAIEREIDRGVTQWAERLGGELCVKGTRLTLTHLKRLTRREMKTVYGLSAQQVEDVIRYWRVRGFEKVR